MPDKKKAGRPKVENKRVAKSFTLDPDLVSAIEAESEQTGETMSNVANRWLRVGKTFSGAGSNTPPAPWKRVESPADVAKHAPEVSKKPLESVQDAHALRAVPKPGKGKR